MTFVEVLLNVLSIIAIVAVGGFVIYFLGGVLLNILESKNKNEKGSTQNFVEEKTIVQEKTIEPEPQQTYEETISEEKFVLEDDEKLQGVDYNKATEEKKSLSGAEVNTVIAEEPKSVDNLFSDEKDFDFEDFDFDAFFNEQNQAAEAKVEVSSSEPAQTTVQPEPAVNAPTDEVKLEEVAVQPAEQAIQTQQAPEVKTQAQELEQLEVLESIPVVEETQAVLTEEVAQEDGVEQLVIEEVNADVEEAIVEEIPQQPILLPETKSYAQQNLVQSVNTTENVENNQLLETTTLVEVHNTALEEELRAEISALKAELYEQKRLYDELKAQTEENQKKWNEEKENLEQLYAAAEKREQENQEKTQSALSIEEYEARLAVLRERLKINETELRMNRKEFIPLKRVRKNLDKDKSKLRRREALVAKQKVLLYGVNNIMEIDQEKAKKLAEDLDLLDGLKVSVRHCEEVMEANKERYPILETANRILVTQNEEIKADIAACELAIRKIKAGNGDDVASLELAAIALQDMPVKRKRGRPRKIKPEESAQTTANAQANNANQNVETLETINLIEEQESLENLDLQLENQDTTILHTAQTENVEKSEPEVAVIETVDTEVESFNNDTKVTTKTTVATTEKTQIISQTTTEHKFDFDAEEPSLEDLFAIEQENLFLSDDKLFEDNDDSKK